MIDQYLKNLSEEFGFPYNHLNKILTCNLQPPFTIQYKEHHLKFFGLLGPCKENIKEEVYLRLMQLNLSLESLENLNIGLTSDDMFCLNAELNFNLSAAQIKNQIESFANHLDKISTMIQDLNKKT